jgi:glycosyltransferase involved in cell wall biosynthesis
MNFSQYVPLIRAFNTNAKFVLHMHCEWLTQLDASMIEGRLQQTDLVIGCSDYITNKIRIRFPEHADRCQTVFNGVDLARFAAKNGTGAVQKDDVKRLLFSGRISPEKGIHVLLDAFRQVIKHYPDSLLELAGAVGIAPMKFIVALSDEASVQALATLYEGNDYLTQLKAKLSPDISNRVSFLGFVPHSHLVDNYRRADVLINPSLSEAFGMSLVEAMAVGTPVVAARVGGMVDIVEDGETGVLVEPGNAEALAEGIISIISNPELGKALGQAGQKRVQELFTWEQVTHNLARYYQSL